MDKIAERIRQKLPNRNEAFLVLSACIFPLHFWISLVLLHKVPSLILKADVWQIMGVFAYVFSVAFIESLLIFGLLVLLSTILPRWIFKNRFVYLGTSLALLISGLLLLINSPILQDGNWIIYPILLVIFIYLIFLLRKPSETMRQSAIAERLTIMSTLYIIIDITSIVYIGLRQII